MISKCRSTFFSCTIMGATGLSTASGLPLIASTSDDPWDTRTRVIVQTPKEGYKYIGTQIITPAHQPRVPWSDMITRGVNERGFAYTWAYVHPSKEPPYDRVSGITFREAGELIISKAATVAEAIDMMKKQSRAYHGNFLLAEATGKIALIEVSTNSINVETVTVNGWVARSNHWISPEMAQIAEPVEPNSSSDIRFKRMKTLLSQQRQPITIQTIMKVYRDHWGRDQYGWSICQHGERKERTEEELISVSAEIMNPSHQVFFYNYGWPCGEIPKKLDQQKSQEMSWGAYLPFFLQGLKEGEYVTIYGQLTPLAIRYLANKNVVIASLR